MGVPIAMGARWLVAGFGAGGRRGFELARPVAAGQLAAAKLSTAILAMAFGGALLACLPEMVANREEFGRDLAGFFAESIVATPTRSLWLGYAMPEVEIGTAELYFWVFGALPLLLVLLLVLAQTFFAAVGRDRHSLLSLAGLLLAAAALWSYHRFSETSPWASASAGCRRSPVAAAGLGFFSAWRSFAAGSLLGPAHRGYSRAFGAGFATLAAVLAICSHQATSPEIGDLRGYSLVSPNPDGSWLVGGNLGRGFLPVFHLDPARRQATYVGPLYRQSFMNVLGEKASILGIGFRWPDYFLHFAPGRPPVRLPEAFGGDDPGFARLDADGSVLVRLAGRELSVVRVADGRELGRIAIPAPGIEEFMMPGMHGPFRKTAASEGSVALLNRQGTEFDLLVGLPEAREGFVRIERHRFDAASLTLVPESSWTSLAARALGPGELLVGPDLAAARCRSATGGAHRFPLARAPDRRRRRLPRPRRGRENTGRAEVGPDRPPRHLHRIGRVARLGDPGRRDPPRHPGRRPARHQGAVLLQLRNSARRRILCRLRHPADRNPEGRTLRRIPGFLAAVPMVGKARPFLRGPYGEPYDLDSADAEPRPILPWL